MVKLIMNIINRKKHWEFMVFESHKGYINTKLNSLISEGWEIAGSSTVKYHDAPTNAAFIYIPLKRLRRK